VGTLILSGVARAGGISVDAGLTPAENRWIFRAQVRHMKRTGEMSEMTMYRFPFVLAYGVRSDFTLMARQIVTRRSMTMGGDTETESGFDDFFLLFKYKAYRRNTRTSTFGIAPTLALEMPTGSDTFSSETWDLAAGFYFSWRSGLWASDLNLGYKWNSVSDRSKDGLVPGDEAKMDWAVAYQYSIGGSANSSLTPVLELNYEDRMAAKNDQVAVENTGGSTLYVSPGLKYTTPKVIVEGLVRVPVTWSLNGTQPDPAVGLLVGIRLLF
jgi:hypothetical protein